MPNASFPDWIVRELEHVELGDTRLNRRLQQIVTDLSQNPQTSIPEASGTWARTKGAYRFFDHAAVTAEAILAGHQVAALARLAAQPIVLMVQDTTSLNYACQAAASGLGPLGNRAAKALGLWLHTTLAVDVQGTALGLMHTKMWTRDPARAGVARQRKRRPLADKESQRWLASFAECVRLAGQLPGCRLINVADREGDLYELFAHAAAHPEVGVLVRARHNRRLVQEEKRLWDFIAAPPVAGLLEITVPRQPGRASHQVTLEIRFRAVRVPNQGGGAPLPLWMVEARERGGGPQALCWRLLTNQAVPDLATAVAMVRWYGQRWRIEEFHRVLKTGCQAERRQLETVARLQNVLAVDMIIAWRVLALTRAARHSPAAPATELLTAVEVQVLCALHPKLAGGRPLDLRAAVRAIAQRGGFLARKGDGEPGPMTLWRGLLRLNDYVNAFTLLTKTCG
jgi:hypothetical protein